MNLSPISIVVKNLRILGRGKLRYGPDERNASRKQLY